MISVDIDGVLNEYPNNWLHFLANRFNVNFESIEDAKKQLTYHQYKLMKLEFRKSSYERHTPPRKRVIQSLNNLTNQSHKIVVHTSRRILEWPWYFDLTHEWLLDSGLRFDILTLKTPDSLKSKKCLIHIDDELPFLQLATESGFKGHLFHFSPTGDPSGQFETISEEDIENRISSQLAASLDQRNLMEKPKHPA
jgi:hypothetical protein